MPNSRKNGMSQRIISSAIGVVIMFIVLAGSYWFANCDNALVCLGRPLVKQDYSELAATCIKWHEMSTTTGRVTELLPMPTLLPRRVVPTYETTINIHSTFSVWKNKNDRVVRITVCSLPDPWLWLHGDKTKVPALLQYRILNYHLLYENESFQSSKTAISKCYLLAPLWRDQQAWELALRI